MAQVRLSQQLHKRGSVTGRISIIFSKKSCRKSVKTLHFVTQRNEIVAYSQTLTLIHDQRPYGIRLVRNTLEGISVITAVSAILTTVNSASNSAKTQICSQISLLFDQFDCAQVTGYKV